MITRKSESIPNYTIDQDTLEHLPPLHRLAAEQALKDGRWKLKDKVKIASEV